MVRKLTPPVLGQTIRVTLAQARGFYDGTILKVLPANEEVSDADLALYYEVTPEHKHYAQVKRPAKAPRFVVEHKPGRYLILPLNGLGTHWTYTAL